MLFVFHSRHAPTPPSPPQQAEPWSLLAGDTAPPRGDEIAQWRSSAGLRVGALQAGGKVGSGGSCSFSGRWCSGFGGVWGFGCPLPLLGEGGGCRGLFLRIPFLGMKVGSVRREEMKRSLGLRSGSLPTARGMRADCRIRLPSGSADLQATACCCEPKSDWRISSAALFFWN